MPGRTRIDFCGGYDAAYYVALEAKRAIERRGIDLHFRSGVLYSGEHRFLRINMKALLAGLFEFHCVKNGRDRITDVPDRVISRLICREVGMRLWPEVR